MRCHGGDNWSAKGKWGCMLYQMNSHCHVTRQLSMIAAQSRFAKWKKGVAPPTESSTPIQAATNRPMTQPGQRRSPFRGWLAYSWLNSIQTDCHILVSTQPRLIRYLYPSSAVVGEESFCRLPFCFNASDLVSSWYDMYRNSDIMRASVVNKLLALLTWNDTLCGLRWICYREIRLVRAIYKYKCTRK